MGIVDPPKVGMVGWASFSAVLSILGVAGLVLGFSSGLFANRPYPEVDVFFFVLSIGTLSGAFVLLLLRSSRNAFTSSNDRAA